MHDKDKAHGDKNLTTKDGKSWNINKVGYIWGVTTLHHYERISSRDLGLKERRVLRTEVILAFPSGFLFGMV